MSLFSRRSERTPLDGVDAVLADLVRPGDLLLTLGEGDITTVGPRLLERLAASSVEG